MDRKMFMLFIEATQKTNQEGKRLETKSLGYLPSNLKLISFDDLARLLQVRKKAVSEKVYADMFSMSEFKTKLITATFMKNNRYLSVCYDNLLSVDALMLDFDGNNTIDNVKEIIKDYRYILYTSYNHLATDVEKFRVIIPLTQTCHKDDIQNRKIALKKFFHGIDKTKDGIDNSTFAKPRRFYVPSYPEGSEDKSVFIYKKEGKDFDLSDMELNPVKETLYEETKNTPKEYTEEERNSILSAIKTMNPNSVQRDHAWMFTAFLKNAGFTKLEVNEVLFPYCGTTDVNRKPEPTRVTNFYDSVTSDNIVTPNVFRSTIRMYGGDTSMIKIKELRGIPKLIKIPAGEIKNFPVDVVEQDLYDKYLVYVKTRQNVLLTHPTGTGKTQLNALMMSKDIDMWPEKDKLKILYLTITKKNQKELAEKLDAAGVKYALLFGRSEHCKHDYYKIKNDPEHAQHSLFKDVLDSFYCNEKVCPFYKKCKYISDFEEAKKEKNKIVIMHQTNINKTSSSHIDLKDMKFTRVILDEGLSDNGLDIKGPIDSNNLSLTMRFVTDSLYETMTKKNVSIYNGFIELTQCKDELINLFPDLVEQIKIEKREKILVKDNNIELKHTIKQETSKILQEISSKHKKRVDRFATLKSLGLEESDSSWRKYVLDISRNYNKSEYKNRKNKVERAIEETVVEEELSEEEMIEALFNIKLPSLWEKLILEHKKFADLNASFMMQLENVFKHKHPMDSLQDFLSDGRNRRHIEATYLKKFIKNVKEIITADIENDTTLLSQSMAMNSKGTFYRRLLPVKGIFKSKLKPAKGLLNPLQRKTSILALDATPFHDFLDIEFDHSFGMEVSFPDNVKVSQIRDRPMYRKTILESATPETVGTSEPEYEILNDIIKRINELGKTKRVGFVGYDQFEKYILKRINPDLIACGNVIINHKGNIRGTNEFEWVDIFISLGINLKHADYYYHMAVFKYGTTISMDKSALVKNMYKMKNSDTWYEQAVGEYAYSDERVQDLCRRDILNEEIQIYGRPRPSRAKRHLQIFVLTSTSVNLEIDELILFRDFLDNKVNALSKNSKVALDFLKLAIKKGEVVSRNDMLDNIAASKVWEAGKPIAHGLSTAKGILAEIKDYFDVITNSDTSKSYMWKN